MTATMERLIKTNDFLGLNEDFTLIEKMFQKKTDLRIN